MVWAAAGNLPEQNKNNKCVNRPPGTAVKKYAGTYDLPCTYMASRIKGITVEIGGDTSGLESKRQIFLLIS